MNKSSPKRELLNQSKNGQKAAILFFSFELVWAVICDYCKHRPSEQEISSVIHRGFRRFVLDFDNTLPLIRQHDVVVQSLKKTLSWNVEVDFSNLDSKTQWLDFGGQRSRLMFTCTSSEVMTVLKWWHHNVLQDFMHDKILTFILTRVTTGPLIWLVLSIRWLVWYHTTEF